MADVWAVVTKDGCPWCDDVKNFLFSRDINYREVNITNDPLLLTFIRDDLGLTSVPQVFHNGYLVGGYKDTVEYLRDLFFKPEGQLELKLD